MLARAAADAAAVYDAIAERPVDPLDRKLLSGLRSGIPRPIVEDAGLEDDVSTAFDGAICEMQKLGVTVSDVDLPAMTTAKAANFTLIAAAGFTSREAMLREKLDLIGPVTRRYVSTGAFARATGWPAVAIPPGAGSVGLPIGFQVAGPRQSELMLLNLANAYGEATGDQHWLAPI